MTDAPERTALSEWWRDAVIAWERDEQPPDGIYGKLDEIAALEQERDEAVKLAAEWHAKAINRNTELRDLRAAVADLFDDHCTPVAVVEAQYMDGPYEWEHVASIGPDYSGAGPLWEYERPVLRNIRIRETKIMDKLRRLRALAGRDE
jgi:hypothetical protein